MTALAQPKDVPPADLVAAGQGDPPVTGAPATATPATPETAAGDATSPPQPDATAEAATADEPLPPPTYEPSTEATADAVTIEGGGCEPPELPDVAALAQDGPAVGWLHLRVLADTLDDLMQTRIGVTNRVQRAAIEVVPIGQYLDGMHDSEKMLRNALRRQFRVVAPEIREWTVNTPGLGEPLMARLLGAVGHPLLALPHAWVPDPPADHECSDVCGKDRHLIALDPYIRSPRQFLAYCGWGDPARRRRAGMSAADALALGNQRARSLAYVMAQGCIKQNGGRSVNRAAAEQVPAAATLEASAPSAAAEPLAALHGGVPEGSPTADGFAAPHQPRPDVLASALGKSGDPTCGAPVLAPTAELVTGRRRSPYRDVYDLGRERYAERDGWTLGHQHQAAVRLTVKAILLDLWRVAAHLPPRHPAA